MRTYKKFTHIDVDGNKSIQPSVFCDICGWGDFIARSDGIFDFCGRHREREINDWLEMTNNQFSLFEDDYVKRMRAMTEHPSICYDCVNARRTASLELRDKGYTGCSILAKEDLGINENNVTDHILEFDEGGYGWVSLKRRVFEDDDPDTITKGVITNCQLIMRGVKKCRQFQMMLTDY